jgi:hypothetical protein
VGKKVDELAIIGKRAFQMYLFGEILKNFPVDMHQFLIGRALLMSDDVLEYNLKNSDIFIKSFDDGTYPILLEKSYA